MQSEKERQLFYYQREIEFLRVMGQRFSEQHPKIAKRLGLSPSHASDPQVERLIEAFAFLTGYIQRDIDNQLPRVSTALLEALYPSVVRPQPSMGILQMHVNKQAKINAVQTLEKGSVVYTKTADTTVRFQTMRSCDVQPLVVNDVVVRSVKDFPSLANYQGHGVLCVHYKMIGSESSVGQKLRIFINMDRNSALYLYSNLARAQDGVAVVGANEKVTLLNQKVELVGCDLKEHQSSTHAGFELLQDYFILPEKYLFLDVPLPENIDPEGVIILPLAGSYQHGRVMLDRQNILLNCVPVINTFEKISEPLTLDHKRIEYKIVADKKNEDSTEIYKVCDVFASRGVGEKEKRVAPYFAYDCRHSQEDSTAFWYARRVPSTTKLGSDLYLSFVDKNMHTKGLDKETVYARTICTSRYYAADILGGTEFTCETPLPITHMTAVKEMTEPSYVFEGPNLWKCVSLLATDYLSFSQGSAGVERLRGLLSILAGRAAKNFDAEIMSIDQLTVETCVRRFSPNKQWAGFAQGLKICLHIDEHRASADSSYLLQTLLRTFLGTQTHIHMFTDFCVRTNTMEGEWHKWPIQSGIAQTL